MQIKLNVRLHEVLRNQARNKVIVGGRRLGKSEYLLAECVTAAQVPNTVTWYIAPNYRQAKQIFWDRIKYCFDKRHFLKPPNESDLKIFLKNGSTIELKGIEKPDSLRGVAVNTFLLDEVDFMQDAEKIYGTVLRPMLLTTKGRMVAVGSPSGFSLLKEFYDRGQSHVKGWESWLFKTKDFLQPYGHIDPEEFEAARLDMDERSFRQEWDAEFLTAAGRVAYAWGPQNVKPVDYDPKRDVYVSLDFNVTPAAATLSHVENDEIVQQFDEINMSDAWTQSVVERIGDKLDRHEAKILFYGDPAGTHRSSSSKKTDWQIAEDYIRGRFGAKASFHYPTYQFPERDKINALNARIRNSLGDIRYYCDQRCKQTLKDMEQVKVLPDGSIDKRDVMRTHWLDAAGYLCVTKWPIRYGSSVKQFNSNF